MEDNSIETSFCFKYLSNFVGLKRSTIESLVANDYDSIHSLMAFDLDIDLNQLPNVLMGQKSILREALNKLKKEFNLWINCDTKTDLFSGHSLINSTPIPRVKEYPFVSNDQIFKDFITTALMDIKPSIDPNVSSFTDSGINDSQVVKSPLKRGRPSKVTQNESLKKCEEIKENSKQMNNKRKRKKFLYSMKRSIKSSPLSETKAERRVLIDIDSQSKVEDSVQEAIESAIKEGIDDQRDDDWRKKKSEILKLLKNKSNQIELKKNEMILKEMNEFFKIVELNGRVTPFAVCDICFSSNHFRLLTSNQLNMKSHFNSKRHQKDIQYLTSEEMKVSEETDLSVEEVDDLSEELDKTGSKQKTFEELEKTVNSNPEILISKMNISFDGLNNRYFAELLGEESLNSQILINNYEEIFPKVNKTPIYKPYKCNFDGCTFSAIYPFSLDQHIAQHKKTSLTKANSAKQKRKSFSVLKGLNSYVLNYMKRSSTEDSHKVLNRSAPVIGSEEAKSEYYSDLLEPNSECINNTNDQNIDNNLNNKIMTKIKKLIQN